MKIQQTAAPKKSGSQFLQFKCIVFTRRWHVGWKEDNISCDRKKLSLVSKLHSLTLIFVERPSMTTSQSPKSTFEAHTSGCPGSDPSNSIHSSNISEQKLSHSSRQNGKFAKLDPQAIHTHDFPEQNLKNSRKKLKRESSDDCNVCA